MRMCRLLSSALAILVAALVLLPHPATAQEVTRETTPQGLKKMTVDDYALWRSIGQTSLSPDGRWATFAYSQREVDDIAYKLSVLEATAITDNPPWNEWV